MVAWFSAVFKVTLNSPLAFVGVPAVRFDSKERPIDGLGLGLGEPPGDGLGLGEPPGDGLGPVKPWNVPVMMFEPLLVIATVDPTTTGGTV
jgi:hypothetical protein